MFVSSVLCFPYCNSSLSFDNETHFSAKLKTCIFFVFNKSLSITYSYWYQKHFETLPID